MFVVDDAMLRTRLSNAKLPIDRQEIVLFDGKAYQNRLQTATAAQGLLDRFAPLQNQTKYRTFSNEVVETVVDQACELVVSFASFRLDTPS